MFLQSYKIENNSIVNDIVAHDYRTAGVFHKHGIEYCCSGNWSLKMACDMGGLDATLIREELEESMRNISISNDIEFKEWNIDFLIDYIINVHHQYLKAALPEAKDYLDQFAGGHKEKFNYLEPLQKIFLQMSKEIYPHMQKEEEIFFPYIKQIAHAYYNNESYAGLLVRTLRKPVKEFMMHEHELVGTKLLRMRDLTNNYTLPDNACISHLVTFSKLRELDNDLFQHIHLENTLVFPKAMEMEKELLQKRD